MASAKSVAIRQELATGRIVEALKALHVRVGDELRSEVSDPEVKLANVLESIAGALESAALKATAEPEPVKKGKKE